MHKKYILTLIIIIVLFLIVFLLFLSLAQKSGGDIGDNIAYVEIGGQKVKVDLALTQAEQIQGLSGRTNLPPNTGMLFVFARPDKYLFWMKDMNFPIDMIWITENMQVDFIEPNALPESYPQTYGPGQNNEVAKYVLEVPSGFALENNLKIGYNVQFIYR